MRSVLSAGLALVVVLAGCSAPAEPAEKVATLETTGSTSSATASGPPNTASRPRERLDMTNDELIELSQVYDRCLTEHGYGRGKVPGGDGQVTAEGVPPDESKRVAAEAACLGRKPLPPWEYDTANPESADFVHAVVQCLRGKGVRYVEEGPATPGEDRRVVSFGGPDNDSDSITKGLNFIGACEKEQAHR